VGLDPEQRGQFHDLIGALAFDRTVLLSTHLLEDALAIGQHIVVLDTGSVRFTGTLAEMLQRGTGEDGPARLRDAFLTIVKSPPGT
jgi:ABC-2 type transport system ATP-binding protein